MGPYLLNDVDILRRMKDDGEFYAWLEMDLESMDPESELYSEYVLAFHAAQMMNAAIDKIATTAQEKGIILHD